MTEIKKTEINIIDCKIMRYQEALDMQKETLEKRVATEVPNTVFLLEHEPVITLGARESENKLLCSEKAIKDSNIDLVPIRRGGGSTAHNKGQVVIYPIVDLRSMKLGINEYIRELEAIGIELLKELGVKADRKKGLPGLWVGQDKIASIGVRVSRGVTYHGMAINISNDLSIFNYIVPCGLSGVIMTSVEKITAKSFTIEETKQKFAAIILRRWAVYTITN